MTLTSDPDNKSSIVPLQIMLVLALIALTYCGLYGVLRMTHVFVHYYDMDSSYVFSQYKFLDVVFYPLRIFENYVRAVL